jgi:hypothetical protein
MYCGRFVIAGKITRFLADIRRKNNAYNQQRCRSAPPLSLILGLT